MTDPSPDNVIEMRDITKTFPGVRALDRVSFGVRGGEIHSVVGKNGAGKSTLMHILTGLYAPDGGEIWVRGQRIEHMTTARAKQVGIVLVAQHAKFIPGLSIAENIFCGNLPRTAAGFVDWKRLNQEATKRLQRIGLDLDVRRKVEGLSVAERQMIDIARALFADASVIILDEPTAPLPKHEVELLFNFVRRQREQGASFVYISHYLEEVFALADRVTVLRNGQLVGIYPVAELTQPQLIRLISGVEVDRFRRARREVVGRPVLQIEGLTRPGAYTGLRLTLHAGEVVGLTGLEGCGNGALARGLFGLEPLGNGRVLLDGQPYRTRQPGEALARGVAYLPRDRHGLGIIGMRSVRENVSLPILSQLTDLLGFIRGRRERGLVRGYIETLGIKTPGLNQPVENLSGGNQQKVVVAKLVATSPKVLLLDEPTQGVDVQAKVEILKIVDDLTTRGVAVAIVSDELGELMDVCDRILVLYRGAVVAEFHHGDPGMTHERIMRAIEGETLTHGAA